MTDEIRSEIKELAKSMYAEDKGRDEFLVECKKYEVEFKSGEELTDEEAQKAAQVLTEIWSKSLVEAENDKLGQVVSDVLTVLGKEKTITHFSDREALVDYLNPLTANVIKVLTDSGLSIGDAFKVLDSAHGKIKSVCDEVNKAVNVHINKAFKAKVGKYQGECTMQEIVDILGEVDDSK